MLFVLSKIFLIWLTLIVLGVICLVLVKRKRQLRIKIMVISYSAIFCLIAFLGPDFSKDFFIRLVRMDFFDAPDQTDFWEGFTQRWVRVSPKGRHCLSLLDGSHKGIIKEVRTNLADPDSMEHVTTIVSPVNTSGMHTIEMEFRALDGNGDLVTNFASGRISNITCEHDLLSIQY